MIANMRRNAYELYKADWMSRISTERRLDLIRNHIQESILEFPNETEYTSLEEYIEDVGFNGELYVCYDEFLNAEYKDEEYMRELFSNDYIFNAYKKYDPEFGKG